MLSVRQLLVSVNTYVSHLHGNFDQYIILCIQAPTRLLTDAMMTSIQEEMSMVTVDTTVLLFYLALQGMSQLLNFLAIINIVFHSNIQCGQLQCMDGDFQANVGVAVVYGTITFGPIICRYSFNVD